MGSKSNKCMCCGCPPDQCYNQYQSIPPVLLTVDFGNLLCCNGNAGGVQTLRWNGVTWASSVVWCNPEEDGEDCCGTATYRWSTSQASWTLISSRCLCSQSAVPPNRNGAYDNEEVTVICPGNGAGTPPPSGIPCTDGYLNEVLWSGDTFPPPSNVRSLPGTVLWVWGPMQGGHGWGYAISFNGCNPLEIAQQSIPSWTWSPGELCPGTTSVTGVPKYVVTSCTAEPCPPEGYVPGRWVLSPPTVSTPATLELRIGGVVKIRYVMSDNRTFNRACLNKMELEDSGCSVPCADIPQYVCVRPYDPLGGTCSTYAQSYTMTIPTMTVSNPAIAGIDAGQMSEAAGEYALDLIDNNGWDPRWEDNGCRSSTTTCCTWLAPRSGLASSTMICEHSGWLGWVMQTCDPQSRHGLNAKRLENYDCDGEATPVLRFGIYEYKQFEVGLIGPALIEWTQFRGPPFGSQFAGNPNIHPLCCTPGVCGDKVACTPSGGGGPPYYDPELAYAYGYWLTWSLKEILEDGTLVMRMSDTDYTGWVTSFPQEIEVSPS